MLSGCPDGFMEPEVCHFSWRALTAARQMNTELSDWAARAAALLSEILDDAIRSSGEGASQDIAVALQEYADIQNGRPTWRTRLSGTPDREKTALDSL
jgi:anti-sigma factor ChrR (cupin superfamily)